MTKEKLELYDNLEKKYNIDSGQMSEIEFLQEVLEKCELQAYRNGYKVCEEKMERDKNDLS